MSFVKSLVKNNPYYFNQQTGQQINDPNMALGQGIAGAVGLGANIAGIGNSYRRINNQQSLPDVDAYGRPDFNFGQFASDTKALKPHGASAGQVLGATAQGAAAGSEFGLPGMAVGAAVGLVGSAVGGAFRKNQEDTEKHRAEARLMATQNIYNQNMQNYNQNYLGRQSYEDQLKMYNLPTSYV